METKGVIRADGSVQYFGYEPLGAHVLDVRLRTKRSINGCVVNLGSITIHFAGGRWWDNGGEHYSSAHVETYTLAEFSRGNEPASYLFTLGRSLLANYHPTNKVATRATMHYLKDREI